MPTALGTSYPEDLVLVSATATLNSSGGYDCVVVIHTPYQAMTFELGIIVYVTEEDGEMYPDFMAYLAEDYTMARNSTETFRVTLPAHSFTMGDAHVSIFANTYY